MPFYDFKCDECKEISSVRRKIDERDEKVVCSCGKVMERLFGFSPPTIYETQSEYHGWKVKKGIQEGIKKRHREHMKENLGSMIQSHGYDTLKKTTLVNDKGSTSKELDEI